jgi:glutamine amidotransferase
VTTRAVIVDYGMGNLRSVANAVAAIGGEPIVTAHPSDLGRASHVILPGVGAFGDGMEGLEVRGWPEALAKHVVDGGLPLLGICLGMQLLAARGLEHGEHEGLGWIDATCSRLPDHPSARVPHIGWNEVALLPPTVLFAGLEERPSFYFVHSYALPHGADGVSAVCEHGERFAAAIELAPSVFGVQFHPEKSHRAGLQVLRNFLAVGT